MKIFLTSLFFFFSSFLIGQAMIVDAPRPVSGGGGTPVEKTYLIASGPDDVEQDVYQAGFSSSSSDLELGFDGGQEQVVGLHYTGIDIPQGSTITSATIQFTSRHADPGACPLIIVMELTTNAGALTANDCDDIMGNTAGFTRTTAETDWSPPDWTSSDEVSPATLTANFATVLQEVINQPGWSSGNAINVLVANELWNAGPSQCRRNARSYNNDPAKAPILEVTYLE